jgi:hypothetical protein
MTAQITHFSTSPNSNRPRYQVAGPVCLAK